MIRMAGWMGVGNNGFDNGLVWERISGIMDGCDNGWV